MATTEIEVAEVAGPGEEQESDDQMKKVFARFDVNGDGKISATELRAVLEALGSPSSPEEVGRMMAEMDKDGDGYVDMKEFCEFYCGGSGRAAAAEEEVTLKEAFKIYDADGNGLISAGELHKVLKSLGEKCSMADCRRMIQSVDCDGDGCVNFAEFKKMMNGGGKSAGANSKYREKEKKICHS